MYTGQAPTLDDEEYPCRKAAAQQMPNIRADPIFSNSTSTECTCWFSCIAGFIRHRRQRATTTQMES